MQHPTKKINNNILSKAVQCAKIKQCFSKSNGNGCQIQLEEMNNIFNINSSENVLHPFYILAEGISVVTAITNNSIEYRCIIKVYQKFTRIVHKCI